MAVGLQKTKYVAVKLRYKTGMKTKDIVLVIGDTRRDAYLTKDDSGTCQTEQLADAWMSPTTATCFSDCLTTFPDSCGSMVYNEATKACTPGSIAFAKIDTFQESIPKTSSNDTLFYITSPIPACNTSNGFALFTLCGSTVCLYLSTSNLQFDDAEQFCADINSDLFIANTWARFSLFWNVSLTYLGQDTFLWLKRDSAENQFVWGNGEPLSDELNEHIWQEGQPNNWNGNGEYCVEAKHLTRPEYYGLNDALCQVEKAFVCEPKL
ncbi:C-type lectin [Plakobranchus ocellatus]|uniref:C-type lectin n=1 Tax=Plakobranchus ocellatus TaxID=259542 RepID=A0AAV4D906_9GAST|nr:C-type lectin [Plakobranchus ocellatus]